MIYFSNNLKFLRKRKGLSQTEMLDVIGFKTSTWNGYETGRSFPNFNDLLVISEYFEVSESDLIHADLSKESSNENIGSSSKHKLYSNTTPEINLPELLKAKEETIESLKQTITAQNIIITSLTEENKRLKK